MEPARARFGLTADGFAIVQGVLDPSAIQRLSEALYEVVETILNEQRMGLYTVHNLLHESLEVREVALLPLLRDTVAPVLGPRAWPVRALYVDRSPGAYWKTVWRQQRTISVRDRVEAPGFGPWSVRGGAYHVEPPAEVLQQMVSVRVALDDFPVDNGAMRVLPGSHTAGRLTAGQIAQTAGEQEGVPCELAAGDALAMAPLLLHALPPTHAWHPRAIQIDYSSLADPAPGLSWL